jgi:transposase
LKDKQRRKFTGDEKVSILKRHLMAKELVSDICDELNILPNQFYRWEKEFFENGSAAFEKKTNPENSKIRMLNEKIVQLETKLSHKNHVIAEITEDYVKLKKNSGET